MKVLILFLYLYTNAYAIDQIIVDKHAPGKYSRRGYASQVLKLALDKTIKKYGQYTIIQTFRMTRNRALVQLQNGSISVYDAPTRNEWENKTIPIYIPLTKGLLGFRLLLIKSSNLSKFSRVDNINDLKKLSAGLSSQWSTTKVLKGIGGFKIVEGNSYNSLFTMLELGRFDYFIRGLNEVYGEYENVRTESPEIIIENKLLLHIPMPMYFFVSKKYPKIAKRIEEGLQIAIKDGSFDRMFYKYHKESILKANLRSRTLIDIGNPYYKRNKKYSNPKFWIDLKELKRIK